MAQQFKITNFSGTVKKISSKNWLTTIGAGGAWENSSASTVSIGDTLTIGSDRDMLILENNNYVEIKFTADSSGSDGQGFRMPIGFKTMTLEAKSGTVKVLQYDKQYYNATLASAFSDSAAITPSVTDGLYAGDMIVCDKSGNFTVKLQLEEYFKYMKTGLDIIGLAK